MTIPALDAAQRAAAQLGWPPPRHDAVSGAIRFDPPGVEGHFVALDVGGAPHLFAFSPRSAVPVALSPTWLGGIPSWDDLASGLRSVIAGAGPLGLAWGVGGVPLTRDPVRGRALGWQALFASDEVLPATARAASERTGGEVAAATANAHVVIVGLGSVGSYIAEQLTRSGVSTFTLIDDDAVEAHNLSRTAYDAADIGRSKVSALESRLARINPAVAVSAIAARFDGIAGDSLRRIFATAALIIAATDDPRTQMLINRCAWQAERPSVYVGLFAGALAGEIGYVIPHLTRCFSCFVGSSRNVSAPAVRTVDYGLDGRLRGEVAVACDIHHVSGAAVKIALAILAAASGADDEGRLGRFLLGAAAQGLSYVHLAMEPSWPGFTGRFAGTPGQYAWQTIWMAAAPDTSCRICGANPDIGDPFDEITPPPDAADIRAELAQ